MARAIERRQDLEAHEAASILQQAKIEREALGQALQDMAAILRHTPVRWRRVGSNTDALFAACAAS